MNEISVSSSEYVLMNGSHRQQLTYITAHEVISFSAHLRGTLRHSSLYISYHRLNACPSEPPSIGRVVSMNRQEKGLKRGYLKDKGRLACFIRVAFKESVF